MPQTTDLPHSTIFDTRSRCDPISGATQPVNLKVETPDVKIRPNHEPLSLRLAVSDAVRGRKGVGGVTESKRPTPEQSLP